MSYTGNTRKPVVVWIMIHHDDGILNVTQTVMDKEQFAEVEKGMTTGIKWFRDQIKSRNKCPFNPANNEVIVQDEEGIPALVADRSGTTEEVPE